MREPKSDPQQYRVYDLEDEFTRGWLRHVRLSRRELQALADKVCRRYRVPSVQLCLPTQPHRYFAQYFGDTEPATVRLYIRTRGGTGRNLPCLLHELAHHIDDYRCNRHNESHGPVFAAILMELYDHYKVVSRSAFKYLARQHGVKIARLRKRLAR